MRRRLISLAVAVTTMIVVAFSVPLALLVRELARDRAIAATQTQANGLATTLAIIGTPTSAQVEALVAIGADDVDLSVLDEQGVVVGSGWFDPGRVDEARQGATVSIVDEAGFSTYVPVIATSGVDLVVLGRVGPDRLERNVALAWSVIAGLGLVLVAVAVWLADRLGQSMVRPVEELAAAADQLGDGSLDVTVDPDGPHEIAAVGAAFNRLVHRIGELLAHERETVADLSHRLRTPLTALRLDADALGAAPGADEVRTDVANLERAVDRLIDDARRPIRSGAGVMADLVEVVEDRAAFWDALASEQGRSATLDVATGPVLVPAARGDLAAMVDALIGNILAHTDEGVGYAVRLTADDGVMLRVTDEGSGFAGLDLVERGVSGDGGTGLGLDIVRRTVQAIGGTVEFANGPDGGASVTIRFPEAMAR